MFSVPRVNVVKSDSGYLVEVLGRTGMKYSEGERSMFVDSEVLSVGKRNSNLHEIHQEMGSTPSRRANQP